MMMLIHYCTKSKCMNIHHILKDVCNAESSLDEYGNVIPRVPILIKFMISALYHTAQKNIDILFSTTTNYYIACFYNYTFLTYYQYFSNRSDLFRHCANSILDSVCLSVCCLSVCNNIFFTIALHTALYHHVVTFKQWAASIPRVSVCLSS